MVRAVSADAEQPPAGAPAGPRALLASPGLAARRLALQAAYGGGIIGAAGALGWGLLRGEARLARLTIGEPTERAPIASGSWGRSRRRDPLHLCVLGDSSAAGFGCAVAEQTPGALLAGSLARELERPILLDVVAAIGARSSHLDAQVARALERPVELAVLMIGTNDVTHRVPVASAIRDLARAVRTLRAAGAQVVVGTCPDLGTVKPLLQPLRQVAAVISRRLARAQTIAVVEAGGTSVSLGDLLGPEFGRQPHLWSADRFHPSPHGYRRLVDVLLPVALEALGEQVPGSQAVSDSVQDISLAAVVASRDPGLAVETLEGEQGAAAVGPGRLARLRRLLPLAGRGEPEGRTDATAEPRPATDL